MTRIISNMFQDIKSNMTQLYVFIALLFYIALIVGVVYLVYLMFRHIFRLMKVEKF